MRAKEAPEITSTHATSFVVDTIRSLVRGRLGRAQFAYLILLVLCTGALYFTAGDYLMGRDSFGKPHGVIVVQAAQEAVTVKISVQTREPPLEPDNPFRDGMIISVEPGGNRYVNGSILGNTAASGSSPSRYSLTLTTTGDWSEVVSTCGTKITRTSINPDLKAVLQSKGDDVGNPREFKATLNEGDALMCRLNVNKIWQKSGSIIYANLPSPVVVSDLLVYPQDNRLASRLQGRFNGLNTEIFAERDAGSLLEASPVPNEEQGNTIRWQNPAPAGTGPQLIALDVAADRWQQKKLFLASAVLGVMGGAIIGLINASLPGDTSGGHNQVENRSREPKRVASGLGWPE